MDLAAGEPALIPQLAPFAPFVGHTYRGTLQQGPDTPPATDVSRWERALNGQAIQITHSVDDGAYGGITLVYWDAAAEAITYDYYTTAGFRTHGTMQADGDRFASLEYVADNAEGVSQVRARFHLRQDGSLDTSSEYLRNGSWFPGHSATYTRAPDAQVVFR